MEPSGDKMDFSGTLGVRACLISTLGSLPPTAAVQATAGFPAAPVAGVMVEHTPS